MPYVGDNAADEFVFVTSKVVATRATSLSRSDSGNSSPQASRRRLHLQPIPTNIDPQQPSPTDHRQKAFATSISSVTKATPLPLELIELLPQHLREKAIRKLTRNTQRLPEISPEFVSKEGSPPERPPLPANYNSGDYSNILDKQDSNTGPDPEHNYDYLTDLVTSDALAVLGRSPALSSRASSVTPSSVPSSIKSSHAPHHTAPAALGISSDSGISSGSSCSSSSSSSVSSRSSSSKSLPRVGSKVSLNGRPLEPPASPKFCRGGMSADTGNSGASSVSNSGNDLSHTKVALTAVLASDDEHASMFRRLETSTPAKSSLLDSFRAGSSQPSPNGSPRPVQKHVSIATITTMGMTHPKHTHHTTTTAPQPQQAKVFIPQQAKVSVPQPVVLQQPSNNPTCPSKDVYSQRNSRTTESTSKPTKSILKDERGSLLGHKVISKPLTSQAQQPLPIQVQPCPQTNTGSVSKQISYIRSAPSSPEMRRACNQVGIPTQVSPQKVSSPRALPRTSGCSASPATGHASPITGRSSPAAGGSSPAAGRASPAAGRPIRSPSPHTDAIYDNIVSNKPYQGSGAILGSSRPTASVIPLANHCIPQYIPIRNNTSTPSVTPPAARRILTPATPVMIAKPPSPPMQRRNARSTTPTGGVEATYPPPMGPMLHYYTPGDQKYPGGYWAPVWGSSPQLYSQGQGDSTPCYPTYVYGHGGPPTAHGGGGYPVAVMCDGRSHSCERLPPGISAPNSPLSGRRSASPWRGGSASPVMARHSPSPEPGGASVGRPPRPRRPPAMRKSKTVEVAYLDLHPMSSGVPTVPGYANPVFAGTPSPAPGANPPTYIANYPYAPLSSFNVHASPYVPPQHLRHHHPHPGYLQQHDPRTSTPTLSVTSAISMSGSLHNSVVSPGQQQYPVTKEKVTYKKFYKCMKSFLKPQAQ